MRVRYIAVRQHCYCLNLYPLRLFLFKHMCCKLRKPVDYCMFCSLHSKPHKENIYYAVLANLMAKSSLPMATSSRFCVESHSTITQVVRLLNKLIDQSINSV